MLASVTQAPHVTAVFEADFGAIIAHREKNKADFARQGAKLTLTTRAREGRLEPADVSQGTFTISNHGVSGSLFAAPIIINQGQSAILGVGKLEKRVVVREVTVA